jgi:hypothetical protein
LNRETAAGGGERRDLLSEWAKLGRDVEGARD